MVAARCRHRPRGGVRSRVGRSSRGPEGNAGNAFGGSNGVLGVIASTLGAASDSITDLVPSATERRRHRTNGRPSTSAGLQRDSAH